MQKVITLLAGPGGLLRIEELLSQRFTDLSERQLLDKFETQLLPFFKLISNDDVNSSPLLRKDVVTIYNIVYLGRNDTQRIVSLFGALATLFFNTVQDPSPEGTQNDSNISDETLQGISCTVAVLAHVVDVNTLAHTESEFVAVADAFAGLLNSLPNSAAFAIAGAKNDVERLRRRLGIGQAVAAFENGHALTGPRATFQLSHHLPGELSEIGARHDNDKIHVDDIQILPTLQEIASARNEYLPQVDPREWHFGGMAGLIDRNFRLLREDTVGQLRDAVKVELQRLTHPGQRIVEQQRQGARTHVYVDVSVSAVRIDEFDGIQAALRFTRPPGNSQPTPSARKTWFEQSRRLGPDSLVCLLSSTGVALFLVVAKLSFKPSQLQTQYKIEKDPDHAYVVAKLVNDRDIRTLLSLTVKRNENVQLSLVEFPGVLLPAFSHTLEALQRASRTLDVPFSDILAPVSSVENPEREIMVRPPNYATRPGFKYNLSSIITTDEDELRFAATDSVEDIADKLCETSTLDRGQSRAVLSSLAQSVALIQGPPGSGKSYTGVQLVRVMLANKPSTQIGPIVVCTHTNHALDAILERSLDDGVSNIVRIGSRSKSERLQDVNLQLLAQREEFTKSEGHQRWLLKTSLKDEAEEFNALIEDFDSIRSHAAVKAFLADNYPAAYAELYALDEDGWHVAGRKEDTELQTWLKGGGSGPSRFRNRTALEDCDLMDMHKAERRLMFDFWISDMEYDVLEKLERVTISFSDIQVNLGGIKTEVNLRVLRQANIIGVTTSGLAGKIELLQAVRPKVLICEEAGEILEAHLLTSLLPSLEHLILIGDHQQLRPRCRIMSCPPNRPEAVNMLSMSRFSSGWYAHKEHMHSRFLYRL